MKGDEVRDRVIELRRVRAGDLQENPRNWRRHPERQRRALRALLKEVGFAAAILARERDDGCLEIVDGHLRRSMDPELVVPVLVLDVDEAEADKLLATLDPLASLALADPGPLAELLASIDTRSEELRRLLADLASGAGVEARSGLVDADEIPPRPAVPRSRVGDLYVLGEHRLLCGDARDTRVVSRLMGEESASLLLTDPPYGVAYQGKTKARLRLANDDAHVIPELLGPAFAAIDPALKSGAAIYLFHPAGHNALAFLSALADRWSLRQILVWRKDSMVLGHADYHYAHEPIAYANKPGEGRWGRGAAGWYGGNAETTVLEVPRPKVSREHPTAKPVALVSRLVVNSSAFGDVVLDPFLGSGSTLIACEQQRRRGYGIEIDPAYVDVAVSRWEAFTGHRAKRARRRHAG
ncbi:MAG TPA: DNA modification methylase [Gemmatimonadales bacterium]|nr:DNA modification methylase [Gemmatimonadales bacterium]